MKIFNYLMLTTCILLSLYANAQSDNCATATLISVTANCSSPNSGTTTGATVSTLSGCVGNADDDVWYRFVATATSHQITVTASPSFDPVVQLFSGTCSGLTTLACQDNGLSGQSETIFASGLTVGQSYYIRVYHYFAGSGSGNFTICVTNPPPAPSNDNCSGAIALNVNTSCVNTAGTSVGATQSIAGCTGNADDDVWFSFIATNAVQTITVTPNGSMDPVVQLFSGTCGSLISLNCVDNGFSGGNEVINAVGLIPGNTYYVRVYDYYFSNGGGTFNICVTGPASASPVNDDPCNAIQLPPVTSACNYLTFTTVGATTSSGPGIPIPASCSGGSAPQQGGFNIAPQPKDVWFAITVPANGIVTIVPQPGFGINDAAMALYSGTCTSLTQIACSDDYNYPGSANDLKPFIKATGLTPGSTVYLRYWAFNGNTTGQFGICVQSPSNDNCADALYICDLDGYSGSTSAAYTTDRPCNMRANAEQNNPPTYTYTPGTCQPGSVFGVAPSPPYTGVGAPLCDVRLDNNSWIRFTAANTTITLTVNITDCWVGNYPSGGIQMQIFTASSPCCGFAPVSDFREGSSTLTITANNLTIGQDYYLLIDGFAGDICNYSIQATGGIQFPAITSANDSICFGDSVVLNGPAGATSYLWSPGGQTTQNITVTPSTTTTYVLLAEGVCGKKQTLTKTIYVKPNPTVQINSGNPVSVCNGYSTTLIASGASSYIWSNSSTSSSINISPTTNTTYSVIGTAANGCKDTAYTNVSVNPTPTSPTVSATNNTICAGQSTTINASGSSGGSGIIYNVYDAATAGNFLGSAPLTVSPTNTTTYYIETINSDSCVALGGRIPITITVNPTPTAAIISATNDTICSGQSTTLTASGSSGGTIIYSFYDALTGGNFLGNSPLTVSPTSTTTYYLEVSNTSGCLANGGRQPYTITVNTTPTSATITTTNDTICAGDSTTITASGSTGGSIVYSFYDAATGGNFLGNSPLTVSPSSTTTYYLEVSTTSGCLATGGRQPVTITVNPTPTTPTITVSNDTICSGDSTLITASGSTGGNISYNFYDALTGGNFLGNSPLSVSPTTSTTYYLEVINSDGCSLPSGRIPVDIVVNPTPTPATISVSDDTICVGESTIITASGSTGGTIIYTFYDSPSGGNFLGNSPLTVSPTSTTTYYLEVSNTSGCLSDTSRTPVTIVVAPNPTPPTITTSGDTVCFGTNVTITASGSTGGNVTYSFYDAPIGGNLLSNNPYSFTALTTTTIYVETSNQFGCTSLSGRTPVTIVVNPLPNAPSLVAGDTEICAGDSTILTASTSTTGAQINWWNAATGGVLLYTGTTYNTGALFATTTYYIESESTEGCINSGGRIPVTVIVNPLPVVTLTSDAINNTIYSNQLVTFTASPSGYDNYEFFLNNNSVQSGSSNIYQTSALKDGYVVYVIVTEGECKSEVNDSLVIRVIPVANAFTPNGDGVNDVFLKGIDLTIVNRWGQQLYQGTDGWDGTFNGKKVAPGTYYYIIKYKNEYGEDVVKNGPVTVVGD
ncbi:MAG: gliding motility-associated C-terminal domain-containing protein [Bacteroidia bacterium]